MALQRLREAAEKAKIELSSSTETTINLPYITASAEGPLHLDEKLTRAQFQQLTADLLDRCKTPFHNVIKDAGIKLSEIDHVILVGGSTRMPAVTELVKELTGGRTPTRASTRTRSSPSAPPSRPVSSRVRSRTSCSSTSPRCPSVSRPRAAS